MPDQTLAEFMVKTKPSDYEIVDGVSKIKANYSSFWPNGYTRTSTLILVDYDNKVEYYEYNLTLGDKADYWKMNSFEFELKPHYLNNSGLKLGGYLTLFTCIFVLNFGNFYKIF